VNPRLWYDLPRILRLAEHADSCTTFVGEGEAGRRPCLVIDALRRIGSNGRSAEPTPHPVSAVDVVGPAGEPGDPPIGGGCLPLTYTNPDDEFWHGPSLLDELRYAAVGDAYWFALDMHPDTTIEPTIHRDREVAALPADTAWVTAHVAVANLGPYPAQVVRGYRRPGGHVFARFRRDIAWWIALDLRCQPSDQRPVETVRVTGEHVELIRHPDSGREHIEPLTADAGGWWRIDGDAWPWTLVDEDESTMAGQGSLWQTWEPDGQQRCTVCHAVDEYDGGELPSMVGYGDDTWSRCRRCGSTEASDPMFGAHQRPAPWPPPRDRQRELDPRTPPHAAEGTRP